MKYLTAVNTVLLACLCVVGWLALHREGESRMDAGASVRQETCPLARYALGLLKKQKRDMARELLLAAARKTTPREQYWQSLASACDAYIAQAPASDANTAVLRRELRIGLLRALAAAERDEQVEKLFSLYERLAVHASDVTPESAPRQEDGSWAVDMLREGLRLDDKHSELSDMLIQIALDNQSMYPGQVQEMWPIIKDHVEKLHVDRDRVVALTIYLDSVTEAIRSCDSIELVERVSAVKTEIETQRRKYMNGWRSTLDDQLKKFLSEVKSGGLNALTGRGRARDGSSAGEAPVPSPNKQDPRAEIEAFQALAKPLGIKLPDTAGLIGDAVSDAVTEAIRKLEADLESLRQRLKTGKVEPARGADNVPNGTREGPCEQLLSRATKLMEHLHSIDVVFWLSRRRSASEQAPEGSELPARRLEKCIERINRLQILAYNLWALRQIHAAGRATTWADYLGEIDVRYLHPSVQALYSQVSDSQLKSEQDPTNRLTAIGILLNKEKIPLTAF